MEQVIAKPLMVVNGRFGRGFKTLVLGTKVDVCVLGR